MDTRVMYLHAHGPGLIHAKSRLAVINYEIICIKVE